MRRLQQAGKQEVAATCSVDITPTHHGLQSVRQHHDESEDRKHSACQPGQPSLLGVVEGDKLLVLAADGDAPLQN